ncbi:MAG: hypothetical protein U0229_09345 [Anaeromyxobacter sp.]
MARRAVCSAAVVIALAGCASARPRYADAIAKAATGSVDSRDFLRSCEASLAEEPRRAQALDEWSKSGRDAVMLELTNSGFPEYEFVIVDNTGARIGDAAGHVRVVTTEEARLAPLLAGLDESALRGDASDLSWDGDCHFISIRRAARERRLAVYGKTTGPLQEVLERLLSVMAAADDQRRRAGE